MKFNNCFHIIFILYIKLVSSSPVIKNPNILNTNQVLLSVAPTTVFDETLQSPNTLQNNHKTVRSAKMKAPDILSFKVETNIKYRYSRTQVTSRMANRDLNASQEATFTVTLPDTAFISDFSMEIDGKLYKAYVEQKKEAKVVYKEAKSKGQTVAIVGASARNSHIFNINVNIKPEGNITFNLMYEELLSRTRGHYEQIIDIRPEQIASVEDFEVLVNIQESHDIRNLTAHKGNNYLRINEHEIQENIIKKLSRNRAQISWKPNTKVEQEEISPGSGFDGQFIIQYDIYRDSNSGEVLLSDGFFVHFFAPNLPPIRKHIVFVLDISRSMDGRKLDQLKESLKKILNELNPDDFFSLITFHSEVFVWSPYVFPYNFNSNLEIYTTVKGTRWNIESAKYYIDSLKAEKLTNILDSLATAIKLISSFKENQKSTDSSPKNIESFILFLTDGIPTIGIKNPSQIEHLIDVSNQNLKIPIFSLGFGNQVDFEFLKRLSLQNYGLSRKIYKAIDASWQLKSFYDEISSPLLKNVVFNYTTPDEYTISELTFIKFPTVFGGKEIAVAGKISENDGDNHKQFRECSKVPNFDKYFIEADHKYFQVQVQGEGREEIVALETPTFLCAFSGMIPGSNSSQKLNLALPRNDDSETLDRLWAYLTIKQLTQKEFSEGTLELLEHGETAKQKALRLAVKFGFVTPMTSLLVMKPDENIKKPTLLKVAGVHFDAQPPTVTPPVLYNIPSKSIADGSSDSDENDYEEAIELAESEEIPLNLESKEESLHSTENSISLESDSDIEFADPEEPLQNASTETNLETKQQNSTVSASSVFDINFPCLIVSFIGIYFSFVYTI